MVIFETFLRSIAILYDRKEPIRKVTRKFKQALKLINLSVGPIFRICFRRGKGLKIRRNRDRNRVLEEFYGNVRIKVCIVVKMYILGMLRIYLLSLSKF